MDLFFLLAVYCCIAMIQMSENILMSKESSYVAMNSSVKKNQGPRAILSQDEEMIFLKELDQIVSEVIGKVTGDTNCLAIVNDNLYNDVFKLHVFEKLKYIPYLKLLVKDNEDLKSPNYKSLKVIKEIQRNGCLSHIIFLANGIQMSRFLIFGDRYRVLNTKARYVFLYDIRLFNPPLHYLWKKFVNVVFLRRYEGRTISERPTVWYELSTVPFPSPVKDILIPKRLDIWRRGKFQKGTDLFGEKTENLRGQVLQAVTFQHLPGSVKKLQSENKTKNKVALQFGGLEIEVLNVLASVMNFVPHIYEAPNGEQEQWGRKILNGTFTGLIGEVVNGRADVALGNLHYTPYHLNLMDLTMPYITECITFLTPEILTDNSWMTLILPFKTNMWTAVILTLFIVGLIFYVLAKKQRFEKDSQNLSFRSAIENNSGIIIIRSEGTTEINDTTEQINHLQQPYDNFIFGELNNGILYTYSMLLLVSLPKLPTGWPLRVLTGWWWLYCILVVVAYRASMTAILAHPAPRITIDSLDQLAASYIACGGWGEQNKDFFLTSLDSSGQRIGQKFHVVYDINKAVSKVAAGEFSYYDNVYFLQAIKLKRYRSMMLNDGNVTKTTGSGQIIDTNLHIMSECAVNMPVSVGLQKNSPLKQQMDKYILRVVEAGLVKKWLKDVMISTLSVEVSEEKSNTKALMDLKKLYGALVALGAGYLISLFALLVENIYWRCIVLRNPKFDKYNSKNFFSTKAITQ